MGHKMNPPFRADHVGSFLRPQELLEARRQAQSGALTEVQLRDVEDKYIAELVKKQQEAGIKSVTDGEFRRAFFHLDFLQKLDGVAVTGAIKSHGSEVHSSPPTLSVTGKLGISKSVELDNFNYIKSLVDPTTGALAKITIPSPTMVHFRGGRASIDITAYPDLDLFFDDLAQVYRAEIDMLYKAGCRYIQLDDTNLAYLCDPGMRAAAAERHGGVDALPLQYAKLINECIDGRPDDLCIAIHLCRGNFRSQWFAQGGYEPIAEVLFNKLNVDAYFLEWESDRAGDFKPLRFLPKGKVVVLGLVSSKISTLEAKEDIIKRIREAAQYAPLEQLALSPQCGFSSTEEGNAITYESQWEKMKLVIDIAKEVWSDA
ncbi:UROD/MetE-like protein [Fistulina hepatica ATCC 64428]|nr:UROD/MetE-like protein [Fistulina hepatica ATCC 64428]